MTSCTAIIPYRPPVSSEEFIRREIERVQRLVTLTNLTNLDLSGRDPSDCHLITDAGLANLEPSKKEPLGVLIIGASRVFVRQRGALSTSFSGSTRRGIELDLLRRGPRLLEVRLDEASEKFDYWMKNYTHRVEKTHAEELLDWIFCDSGGELISTFDEFIALARKLDGNGYEFKIMPSKEQFDEAMSIFIQKQGPRALLASFSGSTRRRIELDLLRRGPRLLEVRLDKASEEFDYWMKNYTHRVEKTHAEELLDWIFCDSGGELISTFDEFIALARKLDGNGYEFKIMPSKEQFDEAMSTFILLTQERNTNPLGFG